MRRLVHHLARHLAGALLLVAAGTAGAQAWPDRPQRWVVPFPAGGVLNTLTRAVAEPLQASGGHPVVVRNMPGAAGNLGIQAVSRTAGDGGTWLLVPQGNITINATLMPNAPFKWERDFKAVTLLAYAANVMVAHPSLPVRNVREFDALAKAQPDKLSYGSPGVGSSLHLIGELFKSEAGIQMLHVPYKGATPAVQDAVGSQVQVLSGAVPTLLPMIKEGRLRAIAVTTARRADALPDVATLAESGIAIELPSWYGVMAPATTPEALVEHAQAALVAAALTPATRDKLLAQGLYPLGNRHDGFAAQIQREAANWARVIRVAGIKAE